MIAMMVKTTTKKTRMMTMKNNLCLHPNAAVHRRKFVVNVARKNKLRGNYGQNQ